MWCDCAQKKSSMRLAYPKENSVGDSGEVDLSCAATRYFGTPSAVALVGFSLDFLYRPK